MMNLNSIMAGAALAVSLMAAVSCDRFDDPQSLFIRNDSPEEDASFDLADGNVVFRWQAGGVQEGGYVFCLSADRYGEASERVELLPTQFRYEADAVDLDRILKGWGYLPRQTASVWWRVESEDGSVGDISGYRKINLTTLAMDAVDIVQTAPEDNAIVAFNDMEEVSFSWEPVPQADVYSLEFSLTPDGQPIQLATDTDSYTSPEAVISADVFRLVYEEYLDEGSEVVLYWKVRSGTQEAPGTSGVRAIRLAGELLPVASLQAYPGNHRTQLTWRLTDPRISSVKIEWAADGSMEVPVPAGTEEMSQIIDNLAPGEYTFTLTGYDESGNAAEKTSSVSVEVYDLESLRGNIREKSAGIAALLRDGIELTVSGETDEMLSRCELLYTGADGSAASIDVDRTAESILVPAEDIGADSGMTFVCHYSPAPGALDEIVTQQALLVPSYGLVPLSGISHWPNADNAGALPNEMGYYNASFPYSMMFDGITDNDLNMWHTSGEWTENLLLQQPIIATFDLGGTYRLSSYVVWGRFGGTPQTGPKGDGDVESAQSTNSYWSFGSYNPRKFKLYGSAEAPKNTTDADYWAADGGWLQDWTLLADSEVTRPSHNVSTFRNEGSTSSLVPNEFYIPTAEDLEAASNGAEFGFDLELPAVRYVRLVITESWNPRQYYRVTCGELHFYQYTPIE